MFETIVFFFIRINCVRANTLELIGIDTTAIKTAHESENSRVHASILL